MTSIIIDNTYCHLQTDNEKLNLILWEKLRFKERGYFHNRRYKMKLWDGYVDFYNRKSGRFLTGLLPEVRLVLKKLKIPYKVSDARGDHCFDVSEIDENFMNQFKPSGHKQITLHDYQVDFINQALRHKRGVIYSPTSSGKSFMMVGILAALKPATPTLVLQNRKGLAQQNYEEISKWCPNVGCLWGGKKNPDIITVATVQSVSNIEKLLPKVKVLVVDEIHDMMSKIPKAVYRKLKSCNTRIALSATPFKFGEKDDVQKFFVKGFFGPVLKTGSTTSGILTTKELQARNILAKSHCTFWPIDEPEIPHDVYADAVTRGIAESWHFHDVVTRLANRMNGRTLILVERLAHGDALHKLLPGSLWVQGKDTDDTRKEVVKQLQTASGDVIAIATQQIFNTGINVFLHNLINAAGGQADHLIIQRMGRGLRTANDKEMLQYHDFVFNINDYLLQHSNKRIKILEKEGHEIVIKKDIDF